MSDSLLFDVSPNQDDPSSRRSKRQKKASEPTPAPAAAPHQTAALYGRADDFVCLDQNCLGTAHDITHISSGNWRIECAFCGMGQWVPAKKLEGIFRFPEGLFEGLTVDEASRQKNGMDYIRFVAEKDRSEEVRKACRSWLDSFGGRP